MQNSSSSSSPPCILVVDDGATIRMFLRQALEQAGFTVEEAENGRHALELFPRANPDLVLLDVVMHGLKLAFGGVAMGLVAALALTRLIETLLFGIQPSDPITFLGVAVTLIVIAVMASFVPAFRAVRIDPIVVLRND